MPQRSGRTTPSPAAVKPWMLCLVGLAVLSACGCAGLRPAWPRPKVACVLPPNPSVEQVVAHVNANVDKVHGYRASSLKIRANNLPLGGHLVVEQGKRLRLEVSSLAGKEVDLGSNDDVFWIWVKRNEQPGVYYAAHADMDLARQAMPIPFEPEWLMEALGVVPLSTENVELETVPNGPLRLVSNHQLPSGQTIQKVIVVDPCRGEVKEHSTFDAQGRVLVRARLQDYRLDPGSGAMLARHIKLEWPQAEMSLAMDLGQVEVNPSSTPAAVWEMPQPPGCRLVDLGAIGRNRSPEPFTSPGSTLISKTGKARISDGQPPAARQPWGKETRIATGPEDDFRAPEIQGTSGILLDEPQFFEPQPQGPIISTQPF
jgi:hypothetical protein